MGEAAAAFLACLSIDQKHRAVVPFADQAERTNWHYTPILRKGLSLSEMAFPQRQKALQLVNAGLSRTGFVTASTVMGIESALDMLEDLGTDTSGQRSTALFPDCFRQPR